MPTPEEHYAEAERLGDEIREAMNLITEQDGAYPPEEVALAQTAVTQRIALAQMHATLATAPPPPSTPAEIEVTEEMIDAALSSSWNELALATAMTRGTASMRAVMCAAIEAALRVAR